MNYDHFNAISEYPCFLPTQNFNGTKFESSHSRLQQELIKTLRKIYTKLYDNCFLTQWQFDSGARRSQCVVRVNKVFIEISYSILISTFSWRNKLQGNLLAVVLFDISLLLYYTTPTLLTIWYHF